MIKRTYFLSAKCQNITSYRVLTITSFFEEPAGKVLEAILEVIANDLDRSPEEFAVLSFNRV